MSAVGNPASLQVQNLKESPGVICGEVAFEGTGATGWSGWQKFYLVDGEMGLESWGSPYSGFYKGYCVL